MILVDTSIWVEHLREPNTELVGLLNDGRVVIHPFVIGEVTLGGVARKVIDELRELPPVLAATDEEVLIFINRHNLVGRRIGYLDAHLLASALLNGDTQIWTLDKSMQSVAASLSIAANLMQ